jgi:hypothetical protein
VTRLARLVERIVQTVFELVGQHLGGPFLHGASVQ